MSNHTLFVQTDKVTRSHMNTCTIGVTVSSKVRLKRVSDP